ncbi:MAG: hypothetical protein LBP59_00685 [Planctomycetaceae bacterium]|jgi:hypothetical protein|nr:hypothetical protein [Planctomycetaceae bacterium]
MIAEVDLNVLMPLLEDVRNVFTSDNFLCGNDSNIQISRWRDKEEFKCEIKDIDFYHYCILASNENTPYTELDNDLVDYASELYCKLANYTSREFVYFIDNWMESITNTTDKNPQLHALMEYVIKKKKIASDQMHNYRRHGVVTVSRHVGAITSMRTVILSKRFIPIELMLEAYRNGLYPFGWSFMDNTIYCLNPIIIRDDNIAT